VRGGSEEYISENVVQEACVNVAEDVEAWDSGKILETLAEE